MKNVSKFKKPLLFISTLLCSVLFSCHNHMNESVVIESIETSNIDSYKYKIRLDFFVFDQYLYTSKEYHVGDTLVFVKY